MRNDDALTADEVAELLQVSRSTVYKLVKADELASYHVGRKMRFAMADVENYIARAKRTLPPLSHSKPADPPDRFIIAGNDVVGDVIANYLGSTRTAIERLYEGSYRSLVDMYLGNAQAALVHLYDAATKTYNIPAVQRLLPGVPVHVVHVVKRRQGLIVAKSNPLGIRTWDDAFSPSVRWAPREKGSGSRILLDEQLAARSLTGDNLAGYEREAPSALSMASLVARGGADVGIGAERVYHQVEGVDFLPLQDEWLDIVLTRDPRWESVSQTVINLLRSRSFRAEIASIVGYDVQHMGETVFKR